MVKEVVVGLLMAIFLVAAITSGDASKSRSSDNSDAVIEEDQYGYWNGVKLYAPGNECLPQGGVCAKQNDCNKTENALPKGLCPDKNVGVECCSAVIPKAGPCIRHQGVCMAYCHPNVQVKLGTDCGPEQMCCILVV